MDVDWILFGLGYLLFLVLSRGVLGGATKAMTDWGAANARRRRLTTSSTSS
jgi:hypothetical protein